MSGSDMLICCVADFGEISFVEGIAGAEMDRVEMGRAIAFPGVSHVVKSLPVCVAGVRAEGPVGDVSGHV